MTFRYGRRLAQRLSFGGRLSSVAAGSAGSGSAPASVEDDQQDDRNSDHRTQDEPDLRSRLVPPIEHVRGLLLAWTPREGGQRHAEFATFGELHTSSGHPTAIGSRRAQSSTRIPASTLLLEPEHGKHRPRHVSTETTSSDSRRTLPAYMMPTSYWLVKQQGQPVIARVRRS